MSHPKIPPPQLYFVAITGRILDLWKEVLENLKSELGSFLFQSKIYDFSSFTSYYEKEMGKDLKKTIYFFEKLKPPEYLIELKYKCYEIEKSLAEPSGNRTINLDPGYLGLSKIVLSTFKDYAHRIYLGKGVYAEVTLIYKNKTYVELPWTYPDYRQPEIIEIFNKARAWYKECLNVS
ncbi:MAG: DUF4416 domain-containing protein [Thermodesulfobacterium geofontis]|uniref:DUF4416 domain-containing protein n=1 Tax=Thermodesulfobacterium geofontis TaxID=1295609 RepID=A0A2N7PM97_9BACT|nr:MAG: DUF4416 domain-containing protein [Thermodesulfobacterium geofontis]PMP94327.1 MAG: DUF4416 domain-containing protein [Thermodesulfobacterium geofontis]